MNLSNTEAHNIDEQEKIAHTMKVFRILCLIIHKPVAGFGALIKDSLLLNNCIQAVTRVKTNWFNNIDSFIAFHFSTKKIQIF